MSNSGIPAFTFSASDLPKRRIQQLLASGAVERIGRGLYRRTDLPSADLDLVEIAARSPWATLCLGSALAHYGLVDEIPGEIDIAIPRLTRPPTSTVPVRWHRFDRQTFEIERSIYAIDGDGITMSIYSAERSIVDAFRLRGAVGYELPTEALTNWLKQRGSRPAKLVDIANQLPRSKGPLINALSILS